MKTIHAHSTLILINGMHKRSLVTYQVDHDTPDYRDLDKTLAKETDLKISKGELDCYHVQVTVQFSDLGNYEGFASLGQVFLNPEDLKNEVVSTANDHQLFQDAKAYLIESVLSGQSRINDFLTKVA